MCSIIHFDSYQEEENLKKHTDLKDNIIKLLEQEEDKEKTANEIINLIVDL